MKKSITNIKISIIMGSQSDWKTLVNTEETLEHFKVSYEKNYFCTQNT